MAVPFIELKNAVGGYNRTPVFRPVNIEIPKGEFAGIVGPTGSGKTTFLKIILGLLPPISGEVKVSGVSVYGNKKIPVGYVPQVETVDWDFPVTVEEVVLMGRCKEKAFLPWNSKKDRQDAKNLLERLGLGELAKRHIRALSGGQQQRVFLARALISNPALLILDEPTAGVDIKTQHNVLHLLGELNKEGMTILLTTHDLNAVAAHLPWVICFNKGIIAQGDPEDIFTPAVLKKTYEADMNVIRHGDFVMMAHSTPLSFKKKRKQP
jgi:zinc/manganese transport system ATP-binding protein/zinc transport system ATP-binding protein